MGERELEMAAAVGRFEDEGWRIRKDGTRFWANVMILAASYYFYGSSAAWYLIPLVVTSLIDFLVGGLSA